MVFVCLFRFNLLNIYCKISIYFILVLWLLVDLPEYYGPSEMFDLENSEDFKKFIQQKGGSKNYKLIEFYSPRLTNCINVTQFIFIIIIVIFFHSFFIYIFTIKASIFFSFIYC